MGEIPEVIRRKANQYLAFKRALKEMQELEQRVHVELAGLMRRFDLEQFSRDGHLFAMNDMGGVVVTPKKPVTIQCPDVTCPYAVDGRGAP